MKRLFLNLPNIRTHYSDQLYEGIQSYVHDQADWYINQLHSYEFPTSNEHRNNNQAPLKIESYDALISYASDEFDYEILQEITVPTVVLEPELFNKEFVTLFSDFEPMLQTLLEHIHDCGYEVIAMIDRQFTQSKRQIQILNQFYNKCSDIGLNIKLFNNVKFNIEFTN